MRHHQHQPTTVAILGAHTLVEDILARLLEEEGYDARILEAYPTGVVDELLDGVDAFLSTMRNIPKTAHIPVLSLSPPSSWRCSTNWQRALPGGASSRRRCTR
jgi:hypothetical protein